MGEVVIKHALCKGELTSFSLWGEGFHVISYRCNYIFPPSLFLVEMHDEGEDGVVVTLCIGPFFSYEENYRVRM